MVDRRTDEMERQHADLLDRYWEALAADAAAAAPADLPADVATLSWRLHADARAEEPAPEFVGRLRDRIAAEPAGGAAGPRGRPWRPLRLPRRWLLAVPAAVAALLVAAVVGVVLLNGGAGTASAEEILRKAQATTISPQSAGIHSLVVTQSYVAFFLGGDRRGVPSAEREFHVWYSAPDRQRVEFSYAEFSPDGGLLAEGSHVRVWDGTEYWTYDPNEGTVSVLRQDPNADIYQQGVLIGASPDEVLTDLYASSCRTAKVTGAEELVGRSAYVVELGRARCGLVFPGSDGRRILWVDEETGLILKSESYAADGRLFAALEVTGIEFNGAIDAERFSFTPPPGAELLDRRDQPLGIGTFFRGQQPPSISLDEAREAATFDVQVPAVISEGFEIESVEHYWESELARELRSHADWVLLRYADAQGDWFLITQGYGGLLAGLASVVPPEAEQGTVDVNGTEARWVDGSPTSRWEPGAMTLLSWEVGSPRHIALASNVLTVDQLVAVAASLE